MQKKQAECTACWFVATNDSAERRGWLSIIGTGGGAHVCCAQRFWFSHTKEGTCLVNGPHRTWWHHASLHPGLPIPSLPYIWPPPPPVSGLEISPPLCCCPQPFLSSAHRRLFLNQRKKGRKRSTASAMVSTSYLFTHLDVVQKCSLM